MPLVLCFTAAFTRKATAKHKQGRYTHLQINLLAKKLLNGNEIEKNIEKFWYADISSDGKSHAFNLEGLRISSGHFFIAAFLQ